MTATSRNRVAPHASSESEGRRSALIVAASTYSDPTLRKLRAPGEDAKQLGAVLADQNIGQFHVDTVLDAPADTVRRRIARFCARGGPRDLAFVYLSCHGVLDSRGRLYYATTDTEHDLLSVTAISAPWLIEHLEDCTCRRQILVLDCCHSGAFARRAKGNPNLALQQRVEGRGRVVLTASRATEYSFEDDKIVGDGVASVFTAALVKGLRTGDADDDNDGLISVQEWYDYAYDAVMATDARQNPGLWSFGAEGRLHIARSPRGIVIKPAPLPEYVTVALENPSPRIRVGAVAELGDVLTGTDDARALTARAELEHIAGHDIAAVASAARQLLDAHPPAATQVVASLTHEPPTEQADDRTTRASGARVGAQPTPAKGDDHIDGARLLALNMALNGEPRTETEKYLARTFDLSDRDALLDQVYAKVDGKEDVEPVSAAFREEDLEGARLIALNMALNGQSRAETDKYLAENFDLTDRAALLDEVYASVEG